MNEYYLSIIIPAYNEEYRLLDTIKIISSYFKTKPYKTEIIIIDDGSRDGTYDIAKKFSENSDIQTVVLRNDINMGKGFSVRKGFESSKGEYVLFTDADMSTPIDEIEKLFMKINEGCDIVIGSRSSQDSNVILRQPWLRQFMGRFFNIIVRSFFLEDYKDTQCGFKLFKAGVAKDIANNGRINGFCFDVEILYLARRKGYSIGECGVVWRNSKQSKVRMVTSSFSMFLDLFKIKNAYK